MKFINGIEEEKQHKKSVSNLWAILPEKVDEQLLQEIDTRIDRMNKNYNLYIRRNRLISAIAILETEVNEIQNEINRL